MLCTSSVLTEFCLLWTGFALRQGQGSLVHRHHNTVMLWTSSVLTEFCLLWTGFALRQGQGSFVHWHHKYSGQRHCTPHRLWRAHQRRL